MKLLNNCYVCKFCRRTFSKNNGYATPNLIEHLFREHSSDLHERANLYLADIVKDCFDFHERVTT